MIPESSQSLSHPLLRALRLGEVRIELPCAWTHVPSELCAFGKNEGTGDGFSVGFGISFGLHTAFV